MNPRPLYARLAAEVLAEGAHGEEGSPLALSEAERSRAIAAVSSALAARQARRRRVRGGIVVLSLAASALLAFGAVRAISRSSASAPLAVSSAVPTASAGLARIDPIATPLVGDVRVQTGATVRTIAEGTPLAVGDHVIADRTARASVTLVTGTRLALEGTSDLAMTEADPALTIFTLMHGAVRADVAKLKAGARFLVRTTDAEVEVRGTSFRVAVVPPGAPCAGSNAASTTRVEVTEGVVTVRSGSEEVALHPGQSWPEGCASGVGMPAPSADVKMNAAASPAPADSFHERASREKALREKPRNHPIRSAVPANPDVSNPAIINPAVTPEQERAISDLAAQNDLFSKAMHEKQSGSANAAVATLERFIATYPASPLAESAVAERMKILATSDPARARTAAREYLARYPRGFARGDAEKILATTTP